MGIVEAATSLRSISARRLASGANHAECMASMDILLLCSANAADELADRQIDRDNKYNKRQRKIDADVSYRESIIRSEIDVFGAYKGIKTGICANTINTKS
jgi:hypothetical protein